MSRLVIVLLGLAVSLQASTIAAAQAPPSAALPGVVSNDNRRPAGTVRGGVTEVRLVAALARWRPAGDADSSLVVPALAEEGRAPSLPAPLVRVPAGSRVRFVVRNALADTFLLCVRAAAACGSRDTLRLAPGDSGRLEVAAGAAGTYAYFGARRNRHAPTGWQRAQMSGAFVVDGPRPEPDRIIVLNGFARPRNPAAPQEPERFLIAMNGRIWPQTERLRHTVGDTVRWRVVNGTEGEHPMHLHGFYFTVLARGDGGADTAYAADRRRLVVTESMKPMETMRTEWVPVRAGNWLFHCHKALHVSPQRRADLRNEPPRPAAPVLAGPVASVHAHGAAGAATNHAMEMMSGMVMGIEVSPRKGAAARARDEDARRRIRLLALRRPGGFGADPALGFMVQQGDREPVVDSLVVPGSPIVLTRDEPVAITVVNRLGDATGVHWHGIELESFFDGVPGWSGAGASVAPPIAPNDSFVARFTPPRAGTFIYHAHADEMRQLSSGLVGPMIVLEPGKRWDPATDHVILIGQAGPNDTASVVVNGRATHQPMELKAGVPHRFRIVSITPQDEVDVVMMDAKGTTGRWRAVAKDGADLPPALAVEETARRRFGPGETFDFEIVPAPGDTHLAVLSFTNVLLTLRAR